MLFSFADIHTHVIGRSILSHTTHAHTHTPGKPIIIAFRVGPAPLHTARQPSYIFFTLPFRRKHGRGSATLDTPTGQETLQWKNKTNVLLQYIYGTRTYIHIYVPYTYACVCTRVQCTIISYSYITYSDETRAYDINIIIIVFSFSTKFSHSRRHPPLSVCNGRCVIVVSTVFDPAKRTRV